MALNLALVIECQTSKEPLKALLKAAAGLRVDGEIRKEKKYERCVSGGGKHCRVITVSNAVGTRTVNPLLILMAEFDVDE